MWKLIVKQMWNRKRSNSWVAVELLLVFCLTWYIVDYLFVLNYNYRIPSHRNVENTLQIKLSEFDRNHPEYDKEANEPEMLEANFSRILQTIRNYPGIESIGLSFDGSTPGNGSYFGGGVRSTEDTTRIASGQRITVAPEEDFFNVFRFSTDNGKKMISTKDYEWIPNGILISRSAAMTLFPEGTALGREVERGAGSDQKYIIMGVVDDNKRYDYLRPQNYFYSSRTLNADNLKQAEISVRYHSSLPEKKFQEQFKADMTNSLQIGNFYLLNIIPYTKIEKDVTYDIRMSVKQHIYLMIFFLLCIFLCLMGAFWYRINLRPNEIGLRKALGATRINIHYSLIIEGIWLLLIILLPAMGIEYQFVHADMIDTIGRQGNLNPHYLPDRTLIRFLITNAITFVVLLIVIVAAVWLPARKGASLAAAEALHHE